MIFLFGIRFFEISRPLIIIMIWPFPGCATSPENSHVDNFEPDGYYEPLPSIGKKGYLIKQLASEVYFFFDRSVQQFIYCYFRWCSYHRPYKREGKTIQESYQRNYQSAD